ncbi:MAG: ATP-binding cassette domain-containing protein [Desulfobacteraceae bacterium]|jgi:ABC-2 type transport system ATP-binding protein
MAAQETQPLTSDTVVLAVHDLIKTFTEKDGASIEALRHISFNAKPGEVTGLVGADGAGKTTLIRIAAGLLTPTKGSVTVLGLDSTAHAVEIQSKVGYMPQKFGLYQDLTVSENMDLYADLQGVPMAERKERYERLLQMTGLTPYPKRRAGALSGGMKQKLGLACALIKSPQMLLLDEPTVGVDPVSRRELWKIVYELVEKDGIGVLLATAYLDEAERCHKVVVLHRGVKLAEAAPAQFKKKMEQRVVLVEPPPRIKPRQIQTCLAGADHIVDVTIRSGQVRVVTDGNGSKIVHKALPPEIPAVIHAAVPTFEDAFMDMVPSSNGRFKYDSSQMTCTPTPLSDEVEVVVEARNLQKCFGDFEAVKKLSFAVSRGEIFGLLGPNGAGKSTTFRMLCGLLASSSGKISVAGKDLRRSRARARERLGYMAQQFSLYSQLSVEENLLFFGRAYGLYGKKLQERLHWAFDEFALEHWRNTAAGDLPGGYKQRLAMAAALLHEPDILFLDEPTSGVDPLARREFWLRINGFAQQGVTVVVTTHFMEESEYCDRMLIMSQGESLAMGTPTEIRALARSEQNLEPTIEDAFIGLAEGTISPNKRGLP